MITTLITNQTRLSTNESTNHLTSTPNKKLKIPTDNEEDSANTLDNITISRIEK
jgi:hypothetical protein